MTKWPAMAIPHARLISRWKILLPFLVLGVGAALCGTPMAGDTKLSSIDPEIRNHPASASGEPSLAETRFRVGDKVKISVFEQIESEEDKWASKNKAPLKNFALHAEMSGEYTVQGDGKITIPMLGSFAFAEKNEPSVALECSEAFQKALGRPAVVSISMMERMPISVLGPVRQPGVYAFSQGMTVLHAIARAGGFEDTPKDSWGRIEASREKGKAEVSHQSLKTVLAEAAVLHAERDKTPIESDRLLAVAGADEAQRLLATAMERRKAKIKSDADRRHTLVSQIESDKKNLALLRSQIGPLDQAIVLERGRVESFKKGFEKRYISRNELVQAQSEATATNEKKVALETQILQMEQHLVATQDELARLDTEKGADLEQQIARVDREASEASAGLGASAGILKALKSSGTVRKIEGTELAYTVVRPTPSGPQILSANEYFLLEPGDLIKIEASAP